ncbi:MAG: diaminopimelate epimerase [Bacteroidales bacterium]|nr:diaminopimelate epimerase [Bacteroidales bacterium]
MENNFFIKSHGLGNEYIILDSQKIDFKLTTNAIRRLCNVHFGIGSDGILLKAGSGNADFGLKIFNPDGSEAEKSGNGLRIFCKFLYDYKYVKKREFFVETPGGIVKATIIEEKNGRATMISVDMGKAIFRSRDIPVNSDNLEFIGEKITAGDREFEVNCVSVGNPHCVVIRNRLDVNEIKKYGPLLETHPLFPNRINVQFAKIVSRNEAQILIWERGAGYTLASGSSSCAVACILVKRNLADQNLKINMKGGTLRIEIDKEWNIRMTGEVSETAKGILSPELIGMIDTPLIED